MDAINSTLPNQTLTATDTVVNPDGILGKDDFLQLLITELKYQDPTDPMDSDKILSQTSQLATLEAQTNTNETMTKLAEAFQSSSQFNTVAAIGKMADLGNSDIRLDEGSSVYFEVYFPDNLTSGTMQITDASGNIIRSIDLPELEAGISQFEWDGTDNNGERVDAGSYQVTVNYINDNYEEVSTRVGIYPIESVRFEEGNALLKLGSSYVPLEQIKEIYGG